MRQRRDVFDRLDGQAGGCQSGDRKITPATGPLDANFDFFHTEFLRFFGALLRGHLTRERRALTTAFESAGAGGSPTKRVALHVGDRHIRVIEANFDVRDARSDVSLDLTFLRNFSHSYISKFVCSLTQAKQNNINNVFSKSIDDALRLYGEETIKPIDACP